MHSCREYVNNYLFQECVKTEEKSWKLTLINVTICLLYNLNCLNKGTDLHNEAFKRYILTITILGIDLKFKKKKNKYKLAYKECLVTA